MSFKPDQGSKSHPIQAPGFATAPDPFASISRNRGYDDDDGYAVVILNVVKYADWHGLVELTLKIPMTGLVIN